MRSLTWEWGVFGDAGLFWQTGLFRQALHGCSEHHGGYNSGRLPPHQEIRELAATFSTRLRLLGRVAGSDGGPLLCLAVEQRVACGGWSSGQLTD
jgi:hypothetical protein